MNTTMMTDQYEQAVMERDGRWDGQFVYAVKSTGIYCKPSCPSRRPNMDGVRFFGTCTEAEGAGFRACLRCQPKGGDEPHTEWVTDACRWLAQEDAPTLEALAAHFNYSPTYVQKTFKRLVGVSPRQYAEEQRLLRFKAELQAGTPVAEAVYSAGYTGSSAVYEANNARLGMTPAEYRRNGRGKVIYYVTAPCTLGILLVAGTERGICSVCIGDSESALVETLQNEFLFATLTADTGALAAWVETILHHLAGTHPHLDLPTDVQATAFQRRVWEALRTIPYGETRSYSDVAALIGQPSAVRAVARACATNPVALVNPCHRVVRSDGSMGGYRWGIERKQALLKTESGKQKA
jgi:AraC family transcriptional regulator of adaptative response/methylated-DNA-[protein]-cysteine methyltransferase